VLGVKASIDLAKSNILSGLNAPRSDLTKYSWSSRDRISAVVMSKFIEWFESILTFYLYLRV